MENFFPSSAEFSLLKVTSNWKFDPTNVFSSTQAFIWAQLQLSKVIFCGVIGVLLPILPLFEAQKCLAGLKMYNIGHTLGRSEEKMSSKMLP